MSGRTCPNCGDPVYSNSVAEWCVRCSWGRNRSTSPSPFATLALAVCHAYLGEVRKLIRPAADPAGGAGSKTPMPLKAGGHSAGISSTMTPRDPAGGATTQDGAT